MRAAASIAFSPDAAARNWARPSGTPIISIHRIGNRRDRLCAPRFSHSTDQPAWPSRRDTAVRCRPRTYVAALFPTDVNRADAPVTTTGGIHVAAGVITFI